jgi:hypothetical protein
MAKVRGSFRAVTGAKGSDSARNKGAHIPHKIPDQLPGSIKSKIATAKAGHMKINAPSDMKLPYSL